VEKREDESDEPRRRLGRNALANQIYNLDVRRNQKDHEIEEVREVERIAGARKERLDVDALREKCEQIEQLLRELDFEDKINGGNVRLRQFQKRRQKQIRGKLVHQKKCERATIVAK
jgi:hypothetical protein